MTTLGRHQESMQGSGHRMTLDSADEVHELLAVRTDRTSKLLLFLAFAAFGIGFLLFGIGFIVEHHRPAVWNPLGTYVSPQRVTNGPRIMATDTVDVMGTKCAKQDVYVRGVSEFISVDNPGIVIPRAPGALSIRLKGCQTTTFSNLIPSEVAVLARKGITQWEITGTETPADQNGRTGVPRSWTTESFVVAVK